MSKRGAKKIQVSYLHYAIHDTYVQTTLDPTSQLAIGRLNELAYLIGLEFDFQRPIGHRVSNNAGLDICKFNNLLSSYVIKNDIPCIARLEHSETHTGFHRLHYLEVDKIPIGDELIQALHI
jgi:hypothetical protein